MDEQSSAYLHEELNLIISSLLPTERLKVVTASGDHLSLTDDLTALNDLGPSIELRLADERDAAAITITIDVGKLQGCKASNKSIKLGSSGTDKRSSSWLSENDPCFWDEISDEEYPLYQLVTTHLLPYIQTFVQENSLPPQGTSIPSGLSTTTTDTHTCRPSHILFTSHHLVAPSKRRDLFSLSHSLRLTGFAKTGHPGIIYAQGDYDNLVAFAAEVKSWQWLALRMRVLEEIQEVVSDENSEKGNKGQWEEVEKIGDAIGWLKRNGGREQLLTDLGIGGVRK